MTAKTIDQVNIGLMLVSCILAFIVPFELFLFSYAVLGPLHYLTEMSWLHKRNYFTNGKKDYIFLWALGGMLTILVVASFLHSNWQMSTAYNFFIDLMGAQTFNDVTTFCIYLAFISALAFVLINDWLYKIIFIVVGMFIGMLFSNAPAYFYIFSVFLPTLIHVFVFTGLFILYGALKSKSPTGIASLVVFVVCGISFFVFFPHFSFYKISTYAQNALVESGFSYVNQAFMHLFKLGEASRENIFSSDIGFGIMRFIAFAYTYHYLNWFSKTSVIKWHEVPKQWLAAVIVMWLGAVGLYAYDYRVGLVALYFLSMLHVFLEFPLNYRSIIGIGEEIGTLTGLRKPVPAMVQKGGGGKKK